MTKEQHEAPTWTCRDGRVLPIAQMDTEHLRNAAAMMRRKGFVTADELASMFRCPPRGDHAYDAWENEVAHAWPSGKLEALEDEIARRGAL